jgi:hypothetical protein
MRVALWHLAEIKLAEELDPLRIHLRAAEGVSLIHARRHDKPLAKLHREMSKSA